MFFRKIIFNLFTCICLFVLAVYASAMAEDYVQPFEVKAWQVGQFVEYQVISVEGEGSQNRYRFSLIGSEKIDEKEYFWLQIEISEFVIKRVPEFNKNLTFQMLIPAFTTETLAAHPARIISGGFFVLECNQVESQGFR